MLIQLLFKDMRICRIPILLGCIMAIGGFLFPIAALSGQLAMLRGSDAQAVWMMVLSSGSMLCSITSIFAMTMLAGTIIAAERADRSAEFLANLPPSKRQVLASKLILIGIGLALSLVIGCGGAALANAMTVDQSYIDATVPWTAIVALNFISIGVALSASAMSQSTGAAVGLGFLVPLAVLAVVYSGHRYLGIPNAANLYAASFLSCAVIGLIAFAGGCLYFIRRVEP